MFCVLILFRKEKSENGGQSGLSRSLAFFFLQEQEVIMYIQDE